MGNVDKKLEEIVLTRVMRLNAIVHGFVAGLGAGTLIFLATVFLIIKGGPNVGAHLWLLSQYLPGYSVTFVGSLVGFVYGLVIGFCIGYFTAWVYNWAVTLREHARQPERQR